MAGNEWFLTLLSHDKATMHSIINDAFDEYFSLLTDIAADIYDSCIADFYRKYTPVVYKRHGDLDGFNLYKANDIVYRPDSGIIDLTISSDNLLPYGGENGWERREEVLDAVMSGIRGTTRRTRTRRKWPQAWVTSYPNGHSTHNEWSSSYNTLDDIFDEFVDNAITDLEGIFWRYLEKNV